MMKIDTDMPTYLRLKQCLSEIFPQVTVTLLSSDPVLKELGFVKTVPCQIEINITAEQCDEICELAIDYELDAFGGPDDKELPESSPEYQRYQRYGWLFDFFMYYRL